MGLQYDPFPLQLGFPVLVEGVGGVVSFVGGGGAVKHVVCADVEEAQAVLLCMRRNRSEVVIKTQKV